MIFKPIPPIFFASFIDDISVSKLINSISQKGHEKSGNRKNIQSRAQEAAVAVAAASGSPSLGAAGKGPQLCPSRGSGSRRASRQDRALPPKGLGQPHGEIMRPEAALLLRGGKEQSRKWGQKAPAVLASPQGRPGATPALRICLWFSRFPPGPQCRYNQSGLLNPEKKSAFITNTGSSW